MKMNVLYFEVTYKDDQKRTHYTVVKHFAEVQFIIDRFGKVDYKPVLES